MAFHITGAASTLKHTPLPVAPAPWHTPQELTRVSVARPGDRSLMPADYRIDRSKRLVYGRAWGILTNDDLTDRRAALYRDPAFAPDLDELYDAVEVTEVQVASRVLLQLALSSGFSPTARRAVVVSSDVAFGIARMYALLAGREDTIQVFRDRASAVRWLESPNR
jgi:hypothetical protein